MAKHSKIHCKKYFICKAELSTIYSSSISLFLLLLRYKSGEKKETLYLKVL
jgi:hypothetical protein